MKHKYLFHASISVAIIVVIAGLVLFIPMAKGDTNFVLIDDDDNIDSVYHKVESESKGYTFLAYKLLADVTDYKDDIHTGRYSIKSGALQTYRHMKNGAQASISLTIPSVRTMADLADKVSEKMMFSHNELLSALTDNKTCLKYGYTKETIPALFIPNTYNLYWDTSVDGFLTRMQKENKKFWTFERLQKAKAAGLQPAEVMTVASIVDEETDNIDEMPMIAGMYLNRLHKDMPLQADPTVKYATGQFEAHRIYERMLSVDSPYNTYKYRGLPPGPIRIPSMSAIEAVLNYVHHDYMYMCAKEDFSGTHNFAKTYEEHQINADKYAKALNERGIK